MLTLLELKLFELVIDSLDNELLEIDEKFELPLKSLETFGELRFFFVNNRSLTLGIMLFN